MKPATIDKYIFIQFLPYFFICVALFSFVFLADQLLEITDYIVNYGVGPLTVIMMVTYSFPSFLEYVIPISTMIAVLLVFLSMSADNEVVALKSSGVSIYRFLPPVLAFSLCATLVTGGMTLYGLPWGNLAFQKLVVDVMVTSFDMGIAEREFNNAFPGVMLYVGEIDQDTHRMTDVLIEDRRAGDSGKSSEGSITVSAPTGRFLFDSATHRFALHLENGLINQVNLKEQTTNTIRFETYEINFDLGKRAKTIGSHRKDEKEMFPAELYHYLRTASEKTRERERYRAALMEFYKKGSIPFACLALGLLAFPLGIQTRSRKKSSGVGMALMCFLIYYILLSAGETFAETGSLTPLLGAWLPNLVMIAAGVWFMAKAARDRDIKDDLLRVFYAGRRRRPDNKEK